MSLLKTIRNYVLGATLGVTSMFAPGCRSNAPDTTINNPDAQVAYDNFKERAIGTTSIETFVNEWSDAFLKGPSVTNMPLVSTNKLSLTQSEKDAINHYSALAQYSGAAAKGSHLTTAAVLTHFYGMRDQVATWANLDENKREQAEKNFRLALEEKYGTVFDEASQAQKALLQVLAPENREHYGATLAGIRAKLGTGMYEAKTQKKLEALFAAGDKNIDQHEKWLTVAMALAVREGAWGQDVIDTVNLIDNLERARGAYQPTKLAIANDSKIITYNDKETTVGDLRNLMLEEAIDEYEKNRDNRDDRIFQMKRFPVASGYAGLATQRQIPTVVHLGGIYTLDSRLSEASKTPEDKLFKWADHIIEALPTLLDIGKIGKDIPYLIVPNTPEGDVGFVLDEVLKSYAGFDDANQRVGDESPARRIFLRSLFAAIKYGGIIAGAARGHHGGGSDGGSGNGSDPGVSGKINGSETGGAGIK